MKSMNRRDFLTVSAATAAGAAWAAAFGLGGLGQMARAQEAAGQASRGPGAGGPRRNVLFIVVDDRSNGA